MYKLVSLFAVILFAGCSSVPVTEIKDSTDNTEYIDSGSVTQIIRPVASAAAIAPVYNREASSISSTMSAQPESIASYIPVNSASSQEIVVKVKKVVKIAKDIKAVISETNQEITIADNTAHDEKSNAPDHPSNTGVKISLLGMLLEFTVGNNDNWSTIWKLIVLILFVYGGLRLINFIFDGKQRRRNKTSFVQKLFLQR